MPKPPKDVTDAELRTLEVLWRGGPSTIREVVDVNYPRGSASDVATVKKLLARLEEKGFVHRLREGAAHRFEPAVTRDELIAFRLQGLADSLCGGSKTPILMQLVGDSRITDDQRDRLRSLIEELAPDDEAKP